MAHPEPAGDGVDKIPQTDPPTRCCSALHRSAGCCLEHLLGGLRLHVMVTNSGKVNPNPIRLHNFSFVA